MAQERDGSRLKEEPLGHDGGSGDAKPETDNANHRTVRRIRCYVKQMSGMPSAGDTAYGIPQCEFATCADTVA